MHSETELADHSKGRRTFEECAHTASCTGAHGAGATPGSSRGAGQTWYVYHVTSRCSNREESRHWVVGGKEGECHLDGGEGMNIEVINCKEYKRQNTEL